MSRWILDGRAWLTNEEPPVEMSMLMKFLGLSSTRTHHKYRRELGTPGSKWVQWKDVSHIITAYYWIRCVPGKSSLEEYVALKTRGYADQVKEKLMECGIDINSKIEEFKTWNSQQSMEMVGSNLSKI